MAEIPAFDHTNLRAICDILGDTSSGLTGSEIGQLLQGCRIDDPLPTHTKRLRLFEALNIRQQKDRCGNHVVAFFQKAMNPVRYVGRADIFEDRRSQLNQALSFSGLYLGSDGKLSKVIPARNLTEAQKRADRLRNELISRRVHSDVLKFCRAELLQDNYFHAVFEAAKSVAEKIRDKSSLTDDGTDLVDMAFGLGKSRVPMLAFNSLQTKTERSEQTGLMNLMKGLFGTFRNTTAHAPKIKWVITEEDALDMLSLASLLHRKLDQAVRTQP